MLDENADRLSVKDLVVEYRIAQGLFGRRQLQAVRGVSFQVSAAETLALVGESGSGKSTILRAIAGLTPVATGGILTDGKPFDPTQMRATKAGISMVFQNPNASLNQRLTVRRIIADPLHSKNKSQNQERSVEDLFT